MTVTELRRLVEADPFQALRVVLGTAPASVITELWPEIIQTPIPQGGPQNAVEQLASICRGLFAQHQHIEHKARLHHWKATSGPRKRSELSGRDRRRDIIRQWIEENHFIDKSTYTRADLAPLKQRLASHELNDLDDDPLRREIRIVRRKLQATRATRHNAMCRS